MRVQASPVDIDAAVRILSGNMIQLESQKVQWCARRPKVLVVGTEVLAKVAPIAFVALLHGYIVAAG